MKTNSLLTAWRTRLIFALFVIVFVELIGWHAGARSVALDWPLILLIDVAIAVSVLDLMVRWHTNTWITVLIAAGIFGMAHGLLVTAAIGSNLPLSLLIFGTGAPTLLFWLSWSSFRLLYCGIGAQLRWWALVPVVGLVHGLWVRWLPSLQHIDLATIEIATPLPLVVIGATVLILPAYFLTLPAEIDRDDWLLTPIEWVLVGIPLGVALLIRNQAGDVDDFSMLLALAIVGLLALLMWFFYSLVRRPRFRLDFFAQSSLMIQWVLSLFVFSALAWLAYELPGDSDEALQSLLLFGAIIAFGIGWPPLVSTFISMQAFIELSRQEY